MSACAVAALLRESRGALTRRSYDPAAAMTITGALVLLVYAVVEAPDVGWGDVRTILLFAGSAVLLGAFALIESRHREQRSGRRSWWCEAVYEHAFVERRDKPEQSKGWKGPDTGRVSDPRWPRVMR